MQNTKVSETVKYIGVDDTTIDLFESQYVVPEGISYNSYVILDEKVAVMDTVDSRETEGWLQNLEQTLCGRTVDYIVVHHMEPDHSGSLKLLAEKYPEAKIVGNAKTFQFMFQFFGNDYKERQLVVKEGDMLSLGVHTLTFFMAPMVHWPEVMVSYESFEKILFSADAFGKFGALSSDNGEDWLCEGRRYFVNIVGKYGPQVQALLKKTAALEIQIICPLHGPVLNEDLAFYIDKYNTWSSYQPEDKGVTVAYASIHGNTAKAARYIANLLEEKGITYELFDLSRDDVAEAVESAFRYDKMILAAATYDGGIFSSMDYFLSRLKHKNFQNRKIAIVENGTWAPMAGKQMKAALETMKNITLCENTVTLRSAMKEENKGQIAAMIAELLAD